MSTWGVCTATCALMLLLAGCGSNGAGEPTSTPGLAASPTPTSESPLNGPTAPTATSQPPAPAATFTPGPTCAPRTHNHLNIDLLRLQPGLEGAIITEIDDNSIRIVVQGVELIITGSGKLIGIGGPGDPSRELLVLLSRAIDAANYQC